MYPNKMFTNRCDQDDGIEEGTGVGPLYFRFILIAVPALLLHRLDELGLEILQLERDGIRPVLLEQDGHVLGQLPQLFGDIFADQEHVTLDLLLVLRFERFENERAHDAVADDERHETYVRNQERGYVSQVVQAFPVRLLLTVHDRHLI